MSSASLSDDDLDSLLQVLLWRKHWTPTKLYQLLRQGAYQNGLLLKQAPPRKRIMERLKHLQTQFDSSLVAHATASATHWTATQRGRALFVWGVVSSQIHALEAILQESGESEKQLHQLFLTLTGPQQNSEPFYEVLEWMKTHPADEPLLDSLAKVVCQLSYAIRHLLRFYAHRLNSRSHQLLQRLKKALEKLDPAEQEATRPAKSRRKAHFQPDREAAPQVSLKAIWQFVNKAGAPVTVARVAEQLACSRGVAWSGLEKLSQGGNALLQKRIVMDGTSRRAYYAPHFPARFEHQCL